MFFIDNLKTNGNLSAEDVEYLITKCKELKWSEGVITIINSTFIKNIFVQASLANKLSIINLLLSEEFVQSFVFDSFGLETLQSNGFIKKLKLALYNFPYVTVSWLVEEPLLERDFEYRRYINTIKLNFSPKCIDMLDRVDQYHAVVSLCNKRHQAVKERIGQEGQLGDSESANLKVLETMWD